MKNWTAMTAMVLLLGACASDASPSGSAGGPAFADAGPARIAAPGEALLLDGTGTQLPADGWARWSVLEQPQGAHLTDADLHPEGELLAFARAQVPGRYRFSLLACGAQGCTRDEVEHELQASVTGPNQAPRAAVSYLSFAEVGEPIELDAFGSRDPDGDPLQFNWSLLAAPPSSGLSSLDVVHQTRRRVTVTPDQAGTLRLQLEVDDGALTDVVDIEIEVYDEISAPIPELTASAYRAPVGLPVLLDAQGSSSPMGWTLGQWSYTLVRVPGSSGLTSQNIVGQGQSSALLEMDVRGAYEVELHVGQTPNGIDWDFGEEPDSVVLRAYAARRGLVVRMASFHMSQPGELLTLDASDTSAPADAALTYTWSLLHAPDGAGPSDALLSASDHATAELLTPASGPYLVKLEVSDGQEQLERPIWVLALP